MEMELPTEQSAKEQFKQGPPQPLTDKERAEREKEMMREMDEDTPFLTKRVEYNRLQIEALTQEVMLGIRPAKSVGGLLGLELQVKEINHINYLTQLKNELNHAIEDNKRMEEEMAKKSETAAQEN